MAFSKSASYSFLIFFFGFLLKIPNIATPTISYESIRVFLKLILVLDFKSLYPSIIRTFFIDPLGLIKGLENQENALEGFNGGYFSTSAHHLPKLVEQLSEKRQNAKEQGEAMLSQPAKERMAPPKFADYCVELLKDSVVDVEVIDSIDTINKDYPMLATVARASYAVERHHPRVVKMTYEPEGNVERTLLFVGKGLVYDTGGT